MGTVVALAAQVGGAKLADGLYRLRGRDLTVIVNTGDDYDHLGLLFSPDLDTVIYALAGIASVGAGWEPQGESHAVHDMLKALGGPDRPPIGDKSLAAPILRTEWLRNDRRLTQVTLEFCNRLGIQARVLPMSDDPVRTNVLTDEGAVTFHEYFTQLACEPPVRVRPILEVNGMKELLRKRGAPVIAVTPIVGGKAVKGSAGKMMRELGREPSALAVAGEYLGFIDGFVIDRADARLAENVRSLGLQVLVAQTVMRTDESRLSLARAVLDFARTIQHTKTVEAGA